MTALSGCTKLLEESNSQPDRTRNPNETYTTAQKTTTFSHKGTRTPFPGVESIYAGGPGGTLVITYFDYSHDASLRWWREEYPELRDLIEDGKLRLTLMMFPKPVDRWSVMLPAALFQVRAETDREAAWAFHESLVSAEEYSLDLIERTAADAGADPESVTAAARQRRRRNQMFADKAMGEDSGVELLPAMRWGFESIGGTSAADVRSFIKEQNS
ncbi:DsbA family protein [Halorarum halobium]|uniref:DsbA family protein n=1 Tax=Halorarum halobium TaxID=3075121 RepID=UPI0028AA4301|nr:thioredoxin domain-containing protein [Halobaculum sp. XH14]